MSRGWRMYVVDPGNDETALRAPHGGSVFPPGLAGATCARGLNHPAPGRGCECGFVVATQPGPLIEYWTAHRDAITALTAAGVDPGHLVGAPGHLVLAQVAVRGPVEPGSGVDPPGHVRARGVQPIRLWVPAELGHQAERIGQRYRAIVTVDQVPAADHPAHLAARYGADPPAAGCLDCSLGNPARAGGGPDTYPLCRPCLDDHRHASAGTEWTRCPGGHKHWGRRGAAGVALIDPPGRVLLQRRAPRTHAAGLWSTPGGAIEAGEDTVTAAARELREETGVAAGEPIGIVVHDCGHGWTYTTIVAETSDNTMIVADQESAELRWTDVRDVIGLDLHPGFRETWPQIADLIERHR